MGGSGIDWIDRVFRICVVLLVDLADFFGCQLRRNQHMDICYNLACTNHHRLDLDHRFKIKSAQT